MPWISTAVIVVLLFLFIIGIYNGLVRRRGGACRTSYLSACIAYRIRYGIYKRGFAHRLYYHFLRGGGYNRLRRGLCGGGRQGLKGA